MKQVIDFEPIFDPSLKTLDFSGLSGFELKKLYAVINETKSQIIYAMGSPCYGYTDFTTGVLTLLYNTTQHDSGDVLTVLYEADLSVTVERNLDTPTAPVIANYTAILAATEYSYAFPPNVKKFRFRSRGSAKIQYSYISGNSNTVYSTINSGESLEEYGLNAPSLTIYFTSSKANEIIEITSWI